MYFFNLDQKETSTTSDSNVSLTKMVIFMFFMFFFGNLPLAISFILSNYFTWANKSYAIFNFLALVMIFLYKMCKIFVFFHFNKVFRLVLKKKILTFKNIQVTIKNLFQV